MRRMPVGHPDEADTTPVSEGLARRLGVFDATMIVMGGIIGSGIFATPYAVARQVHSPALILGAWAAGGAIALVGAFIYAELAARRPEVGGQYAYLRDAYHPAVAFVYGWALLLVIQTGGMAAVAVTFASYFVQIVPTQLSEQLIAVIAVAALVAINCVGVRAGSSVQNALMLLKIGAIAALVVTGIFFSADVGAAQSTTPPGLTAGATIAAFGAAMIPIMFSYGGWQTASFVAGEMRNPQRDLARGLVFGVVGVIAAYLLVNIALLRGLDADGLAATTTPATTLMRSVFGEGGAKFLAIGIAISTIGFLSQGMLTAPRVYYAMARDGVFFRKVAWLNPRSQVPVVAIVLQGILTIVIALSGKFEQILNYVVSVDFIFFALTGGTIFVFRLRAQRARAEGDQKVPGVPGHPFTTGVFILAATLIVINTLVTKPADSAIGILLMLAGIPVFFAWRSRAVPQ